MHPSHRTSGILLHPTSLPGPFGIGDLGEAARGFVDFLQDAGQGIWQILPLGPTGYGDSPYQCLSAFAGNPMLISPGLLLEDGWLEEADLTVPPFPSTHVDFGAVTRWKSQLLDRAYRRFGQRASSAQREELAAFCRDQAAWLEDYVAFAALKQAHGMAPWTQWNRDLSLRDPDALRRWLAQHQAELARARFVQFVFFRQWHALRRYANARGIRLIGDIPIFVAHDSSEVWGHPEWFELDETGNPMVVAGVPPDYFSATGQRWGNPLYRWERLEQDGYRFWVSRMQATLELVDIVRIDHFRGFAGYWEIPAAASTAMKGRWVPGPGRRLFDVLQRRLGEDLPLIAEDLGVITDDVVALREGLDLPGMAILQFAFEVSEGGHDRPEYLPHNHRYNLAVYTGTHDNDTLLGWWSRLPAAHRELIQEYLVSDGTAIGRDFIRSALSSVARYAVFPLQDLLGLGSESCMNRPGKAEGNWTWRFPSGSLGSGLARELAELTKRYGRSPFARSDE